jgi:hypothetical protein
LSRDHHYSKDLHNNRSNFSCHFDQLKAPVWPPLTTCNQAVSAAATTWLLVAVWLLLPLLPFCAVCFVVEI